ncbi:MAG: SprB repeat-containing protein, partial [Prevotellaceae bacterium]|nr:SprB repeat-containing protein [Prevotellaceae bacterium]
MKRIVLIFVLTLFALQDIEAQQYIHNEKYIVTIWCRSIKNERGHKARGGSRFYINGIYDDGQSKIIVPDIDLDGFDENQTRTNFAYKSIEVDADPDKRLVKLEIYGSINVRNSGSADREGFSYVTLSSYYPCLTDHTFEYGDDGKRILKVADLPTTIEVSIKPKEVIPEYVKQNNSPFGDTLVLPDKHKITIKPKQNYPLSYKWQYQIGNLTEVNDRWVPHFISYPDSGPYPDPSQEMPWEIEPGVFCGPNTYGWDYSSEQTDGCNQFGGTWTKKEEFSSSTWIDVPAAYNGQPTLDISGNDLMPGTFLEEVVLKKKQVRFRIDYGCGYSDIITLDGKKSAPTISGCNVTPNTCFGEKDAKITLRFSEPLLADELLSISLNNGIFREEHANLTNLHIVDGVYEITGLPGDSTYNIQLFGKYPADNRPVPVPPGSINIPSNTTYTTGEGHTASVPIVSPGPLDLSATPVAVSCFNGDDGAINVNITGGTMPYAIFYKEDTEGTEKIIPDINANNYKIEELKTGQYIIRVTDKHRCIPLNDDASEKKARIEVVQPPDSVKFSSVQILPIKGYNRNDGGITLSTTGGNGGYTYKWKKDNVDFTPSPAQNNAENLAPGKYFVMVKDSKYDESCPSCLSCRDTITIEMIQPDSLTVEVGVKDVVKCYGDSNGSLGALVKGGVEPYESFIWKKKEGNNWVVQDTGDSTTYGLSEGTYALTVVDVNDNETTGLPFVLTQPDPLQIAHFLTGEPSCNGFNNGWAEPIVVGGTTPYTYKWEGEVTTPRIENIESGSYYIRIIDNHGCMTTGFAEITAPTEITVLAEVQHPTCNNASAGSIVLNVTGGAQPYTYHWGGVLGGASLHGLESETHNVTITDANGCYKQLEFELEAPQPPIVDLGEDRTLCKDQRLEINVTINDPAAQYKWYKDGMAFAATPYVSFNQTGHYRLEVIDSNGCIGEDDIHITTSSEEIAASFAMATKVARGKAAKLVNTSHPAPERTEWLIPEDFNISIISQSDEAVELLFLQNGIYTIGLKAMIGACEQQLFKNIEVVDKHDAPGEDNPAEAFLKQLIVYPNPNNGQFTVRVELNEKA